MKFNSVSYLALSTLILATACAKEGDKVTVHEYSDSELTLDCASGFEQLKNNVLALDGMELITETGEQLAYMAGPVSFTVTKESHHAHPLIVRRDIIPDTGDGVSIQMAACGYGPKEDFDKAVKKFDFLNQQFMFQENLSITMSNTDSVKMEMAPASEKRREQAGAGEKEEETISIELEPAEGGESNDSSDQKSDGE